MQNTFGLSTLQYLLSKQQVIGEQGGQTFFIYYMKNKYRVGQKNLVHDKQVQGGAKTSKQLSDPVLLIDTTQ